MPGIDAAIADHLIMLFWDMLDEAANELHGRDGFFYILFIFMAVVMESNKVSIIFIGPGGGNDRTSKISADIFYGSFGSAFAGFDVYQVL